KSSLQRIAADPSDLSALRIESCVHLLFSNHRQSPGACRAAYGTALRTGRPERRPARREVFRLRESARRQPSAWHPPLVPCRDATRGLGVLEAQSPAHCVRPEPSHDRNIDHLLEGRFRDSWRTCREKRWECCNE